MLAGRRDMLYASVADKGAVEAAQRMQEAAKHAQAEAAAQALLKASSVLVYRVCSAPVALCGADARVSGRKAR